MTLTTLKRKLQKIVVADLKKILMGFGCKKTGKKADLIERILLRIRTGSNGKDLEFVVDHFIKHKKFPNGRYMNPSHNNNNNDYLNYVHSHSHSHSHSHTHADGHAQQNLYSNGSFNGNSEIERQREELARKYLDRLSSSNPFAERKRIVLPVKVFKMPYLNCRFNLSSSDYDFLSQNQDSKIKFYALELNNEVNPNELSHQWPTQSELLVNGIYVQLVQKCQDGQHKSKSLKERPADITIYVHKGLNTFRLQGKPNHQLGDWNFGLAITIEIPRPVSSLISGMKRKNLIRPEVTKELIKKMFSGDDDIMTSQMSVSIKCPLSLKRLSIPARGKTCTHLGCFDLETFLNFQRDAKNASWKCIVCNGGPLELDTIVIDGWMTDLLQDIEKTDNVDHVEVFEDGTYKVILEGKNGLADSDDDSLPPKKRKIRQHLPVVANGTINDFNNNTTGMLDPFTLLAGTTDYDWNANPYNPTQFDSHPFGNLAVASNNAYENLNMNMNTNMGGGSLIGSSEDNAIEL